MSNAKTIIALIPSLTSEEAQHVRAALDMSAAMFGGKPSHELIDGDDLWVLDTIARYMQERGLDMTGREQLARGRGYGAFKKKVPGLVKFLKQGGNKTAQRALLTIGVELLYADLLDIGLAITSRSLMAHAHRIVGVINRSFPGYAQSGFLKLIIRKQDVRTKQSDGAVQTGAIRPSRK